MVQLLPEGADVILQPDCGLCHPLPVGFGVELEVELVPADGSPGALIKHRRLAEPPIFSTFLTGTSLHPFSIILGEILFKKRVWSRMVFGSSGRPRWLVADLITWISR